MPNYLYNGNIITENRVINAAKNLGLSVDEYVDKYGFEVEGEQDTAIERTFGKNVVTDFFGDLYRAGTQGIAQGQKNAVVNGENNFVTKPPRNLKLVVTAVLSPAPIIGKSFVLARRSNFGKRTGPIYLRAKPPAINPPKVFISPPRKLPPPPCDSAGLPGSP